MAGHIYVIHGDELRRLSEAPFRSENQFQTLLEDYPELLAGDLADPEDESGTWVLVAREVGIPDAEGASNRWSVDHLFLDRAGVPTLVEGKRASDTRIRREVVGQMLDYAANATVFWPLSAIRAEFEATCTRREEDPDATILALAGAQPDDDDAVERYWQAVKTNLQAGRIRLVFVADQLPAELRRIVEFLNEQMDPAEVLALELRRFEGDGVRTLAPRVVGRTEEARSRKRAAQKERTKWTRPDVLQAVEQAEGPEARAGLEAFFQWADREGVRVWYGTGVMPSAVVILDQDLGGRRVKHHWIGVYPDNGLYMQFQYMKGPFASLQARNQIRERLNQIDGVDIPRHRLESRPIVPIRVLANPQKLGALLQVSQHFVDTIRATN